MGGDKCILGSLRLIENPIERLFEVLVDSQAILDFLDWFLWVGFGRPMRRTTS